MAKVDFKALLRADRGEELKAENMGKRDIIQLVKVYPEDTPEDFDKIGWEEFTDPL